MTSLVAQYRNKISWSAVTESEEAFLKNLIPRLTDNFQDAYTKINNVWKLALQDINTRRQQVWLPKEMWWQAVSPIEKARNYLNQWWWQSTKTTSAPSSVKTQVIKWTAWTYNFKPQ